MTFWMLPSGRFDHFGISAHPQDVRNFSRDASEDHLTIPTFLPILRMYVIVLDTSVRAT